MKKKTEESWDFDDVLACGPLPMLKALWKRTEGKGQYSLEERSQTPCRRRRVLSLTDPLKTPHRPVGPRRMPNSPGYTSASEERKHSTTCANTRRLAHPTSHAHTAGHSPRGRVSLRHSRTKASSSKTAKRGASRQWDAHTCSTLDVKPRRCPKPEELLAVFYNYRVFFAHFSSYT